jgi:chromosome segregation ATPase
MAASIEGVFTRRRATLSFGELLPRYLLVEGALAKKRVLEVGTIDPRSLLRIHDAKAVRVVGTAEDVSRFHPSMFRGRRIEVLPMEPGRIDFDDRSFDVVLVVDLAVELAASPRFLEELKRVLAPGGFAAIAYQSTGRSFVELVEDEGPGSLLEPSRLEDAIREALPKARFYRQMPFIGVAIEPDDQGAGEASLALEPALAGTAQDPSHVIALWGDSAPVPEERTLVELPFRELEAISDAAHARASHDLSRALLALRAAKVEIARRDHSLREIGARLPRLRASIEARAHTAPSPTALLGDGDRELRGLVHRVEEARDALRTKLDRLEQDLEVERAKSRTLEQRIAELESAAVVEFESAPPAQRVLIDDLDSGIHDTRIEPSPTPLARAEKMVAEWESEAHSLRERSEYHEAEASDLRARVDELEAQLAARTSSAQADRAKLEEQVQALRARDAERDQEMLRGKEKNDRLASDLARERMEMDRARRVGRNETDAEVQEAQRRVLQLERTTSMQEQRIDELRQELESQLLVRHSLGSDYRDAEARIAYLTRKLEDQSFDWADQMRALDGRLAVVTDALSRSDQEREVLRARSDELERGSAELQRRADRAENALTSMRLEQRANEERTSESIRELDGARQDSHSKAEELTWLRRALGERDVEIAQLRAAKFSLETDKRAVELAAAHFGQELHQLRIKNQALTFERDTLATTSRMLLEERDAAAMIARRTMEAEERASSVSQILEGAQAAIGRLEHELAESRDRERAEHARVAQLEGDRANLAGELDRARLLHREEQKRLEKADRDRGIAETRVKELDQRLAEMGHRLLESDRIRGAQAHATESLEEMLREAAHAAGAAEREAYAWQARAAELLRGAGEAEQERGRVLADRARAEAALIEAGVKLIEADTDRAMLKAELAELSKRSISTVSSSALEAALREKQAVERALSRTLEEAAHLSTHARELEAAAQAQADVIGRGERERMMIERQRRAAEDAREVAEEARRYLAAEVHGLRQQVSLLEAERADLARLHALQEQERFALEGELLAVREETEVAARDDLHRSAELDALRSQALELSAALESARASMIEAHAEASTLRSRLAWLESERAAIGAGERGKRVLHHLAERTVREDLELEIARLRARLIEVAQAQPPVDVPEVREVVVRLEAPLPAGELEDHALAKLRLERELHAARSSLIAERERVAELAETLGALRTTRPAKVHVGRFDLGQQERAEALETRLFHARGDLDDRNVEHARARAAAERVRIELESEVARLERQLEDASMDAAVLEDEARSVSERSAAAEARVVVAETVAQVYEERIAEAERRARGLEQELERELARSEHAEALAATARENAARASDLERLAEASHARAEQLERALEAANQHVRELERSLESAQVRSNALDGARARVAELERLLEEAQVRTAALEATKARVGELERSLEHAQRIAGELDGARARADQLERSLANAEARANELEGTRSRVIELERLFEESLEARAAEAEVSRARLEALDHSLHQASARAEGLERLLEGAHTSAKELDELRALFRMREEELDRAHARANELENLVVQADGRADELSRLLEGTEMLARELDAARDRSRELEHALGQTRADAESFAETALRLEQRVSLLDQSLDERQARATELERAFLEMQSQVSEMSALLDDRRAEQGELVRQLDETQTKVRELEWQRDMALQRAEGLEAERARVVELETSLETLRAHAGAELRSLRAVLETTESRVRSAEMEAQSAEAATQMLRASYAELEARELALEEERQSLRADLEEVSFRARNAEEQLQAAEERIREAAKIGAPVPSDDLRRLAARANEAEDRAQRAESQAAQTLALADQNSLRAATAEARALKGEEQADRADAAFKKTELRARQAEDRATQAEAVAHQAEQRARDAEMKLRTLDARATDAEERAADLLRLKSELADAQARISELSARASSPPMGSGAASALKARCETLEAAVSYRDGELRRLKHLGEENAGQLDQARAEVGRKVTELRTMQHGLEVMRQDLAAARTDAEALRNKLARQGDADVLKAELDRREHEIARLNADTTARTTEVARLRTLLQRAEQSQVQLERRLVELESSVAEGNHMIELLKREVAEKSERLRRLSGISE